MHPVQWHAQAAPAGMQELAACRATRHQGDGPAGVQMCEAGDSLFVGRYLVNGADMSSLYLEVRAWN